MEEGAAGAERQPALTATRLPDRTRVHCNLGLLYDYLRKDRESGAALTRAADRMGASSRRCFAHGARGGRHPLRKKSHLHNEY